MSIFECFRRDRRLWVPKGEGSPMSVAITATVKALERQGALAPGRFLDEYGKLLDTVQLTDDPAARKEMRRLHDSLAAAQDIPRGD